MAKILTGAEAVAEAVKLCRPRVISAYPITPQTHIIEKLAEYVESGELKARYICTDSELSSIGIAAGAVMEGVRAFTATASHGLVFMHEALHWVAGGRLPVVMAVATRGLGAPWILMCDMQDALSQRDTGWMMIFAQNAQQAHDFIPIAYKVAEQVHLPCMVCMDGFLISHTAEPVEPLEEKDIEPFLPDFNPELKVREAATLWPIPDPDTYYEIRRELFEDHKKALSVWQETFNHWKALTGREYHPIRGYFSEDARYAFVCIGATVETAIYTALSLREKGEKVGVIGITVFRPFPTRELAQICKDLDKVLVIDKAISSGKSGILQQEVQEVVSNLVVGFIGSMGGKDLTPQRIEAFYQKALSLEEGTLWI